MSAPVLSITEQKVAISGKKKKKKTVKNVLDIPSNLRIGINVAALNETEKLSEILERLLPSARLPIQENPRHNKESKEETPEEIKQKAEIKNKRNQLSLGVNALSRNIKRELISAALIAADVQPKFLVHHLNLLCTHNKVPFLHMPELRKITKNSLGFPCIAVGFKKDFSDFSEAVNEIRLLSQNKAQVENNKEIDKSSSEESEEEEVEEIPVKCEEIAFSYLHRSSTKERVFIPESCSNVKVKPEGEFITLSKDDETGLKHNKLGISSKLVKKQKKRGKKFEKLRSPEMYDDDDDDDDEDIEVPKKKIKKDWVIDKVGTKQSFYPAKLMRVPSNPDRHRKNYALQKVSKSLFGIFDKPQKYPGVN